MLRILLIFIVLPLLSLGQIPEPKANSYVNDYTGSLKPEEIQSLNEQILALEQQTTVQLAVLLIDNLPPNVSIEDYARTVGNSWKVGNHFNGLVYVAVLKERKHRLEVARNLEGDIPDITAFEIIESLKPYLKDQQYFNALQLLIAKLVEKLGIKAAPVFHTINYVPFEEASYEPPTPEAIERSEFDKKKAGFDRLGNYIIASIVFALIVFCIWAWRYKRKYVREHTVNGVYMGVGTSYFNSVYGTDSDSDGTSGSSGFGGGGGGGFSGGGASGSW